jgi:hypothetical protein
MAKDTKKKLKVVRAGYVALPAKYVVFTKMEDGTVEYIGAATEYQARTQASSLDKDALQVPTLDFVFDGASSAFDRPIKKK